MPNKKEDATFDGLLARYQKSCVSFIYPFLLGGLVLCFRLDSDAFTYSLTLGVESTFSQFIKANPPFGNEVYSTVFSIIFAVLLIGGAILLSLQAAKARFWALIVAASFYLADTIYTAMLIIPSYSYSIPTIAYGFSLGIHLIFLSLFAFSFVSYGKLWRLQDRLNKKTNNANNGN
jgi:hypothetical protein